jgi:signal transduction histidine kinase
MDGENRQARDRSFWILFAAAWIVYGGLMILTALLEQQPVLPRFASAFPPAALSIIVASRRRLFLRPEWQIWKVAGIHFGIGLVYAVCSALGTVGLTVALGEYEAVFQDHGPGVPVAVFSFYYFLLYAVLAGFMMWSESLSRVEESRALAARESVLRAQAEAKAVRAQFNPHFVFNTLHSLMLLVRADPTAAERAIEDVASLIRYASRLERTDQDVVPLGQELEIARRYVGLESLRLADRMSVGWEVDPQLETVPVPPFSLQTLLENAIKHGIAPREQGGRIQVRVGRETDHLVISVQDDGLGAAPDAVPAEGKGLHLLQRRVATLFGDTASLSWKTSPGEGFSASLRIPIRTNPQSASSGSTASYDGRGP